MFVSTWTLRLTTWSLTQCANGVHREAQQRMFSPDVASCKVSDPQQLNRHKDDFWLPSSLSKKTAPCLHRPPLIHSLAPPCLQARPVRLHPSLLQCGHIHRGFLSLPSAPLLRVLPAGLRAGRSAAPSCVSMQRAQGSGGIGQMENKAAGPRRVQCGGWLRPWAEVGADLSQRVVVIVPKKATPFWPFVLLLSRTPQFQKIVVWNSVLSLIIRWRFFCVFTKSLTLFTLSRGWQEKQANDLSNSRAETPAPVDLT